MKKLTVFLPYLPFALCAFFCIAPTLYGIVNIGVIALYLTAGFLFFLARFRRRMGRWLRRAAAVILILYLGYIAVMSGIMLKAAYLNRPPPNSTAVVVVLGAMVWGDQPSLILQQRLDQAYCYLVDNPQSSVVVSGGQGADEDYPEAQVMAWYLERRGIEPGRIRLEDRSTNTRENLRFSKALLEEGEGEVIIVTNQFHQQRAGIYARAEGLSYYSISAMAPWGLLPSYWLRECLGVPYAWLENL